MWYLHYDPGPCPVDDTPHTGCTPESVGALVSTTRPSQTVSVALPRPGWLRPPVVEHVVSPPFTTGTYKRAEHGRKSFGKGSRTK